MASDQTKGHLSSAAAHWDNRIGLNAAAKKSWWQSKIVFEHLNMLIHGTKSTVYWDGFNKLIKDRAGSLPLAKAISVGCGTAVKEMSLIRMGLVEHFDLYEISGKRIEKGQQMAESYGIADKVTFHQADAFSVAKDENYDLVYWNNSLHHMLDVQAAISWSVDRLGPQGLFAMYEFVGADRWQYSDQMLAAASQFRASLPRKYLARPGMEDAWVGETLRRRSIENMMKLDPTEAADSCSILPSIERLMPDAQVIALGGTIYQLALGEGILGNFDETDEADAGLLKVAMMLDKSLADQGHSNFAVTVHQPKG